MGEAMRLRFGAVSVVAVVAAGTGAGIAYAAIPDADGPVHACYATSSGLLPVAHTKGELRAVDAGEACRSYEQPIVWNQTGPEGPAGPQGEPGPVGPQGDQGPAGPSDVYIARQTDTVITGYRAPGGSDYSAEVLTLTVPAGSYLIQAVVDGAQDLDDHSEGGCELTDPTRIDQRTFWLPYTSFSSPITLVGTRSYSAQTTLHLVCGNNYFNETPYLFEDWYWTDAVITATKVGEIHS
jgi:hypothetical protein